MNSPIFDEDKHCKQVIALFTDGKDVADFCAANLISKQTFFNWLKGSPEFAAAYEVAKMLAESWLNEKGREGMAHGKDFNANVWSMLMRNRCQMSEHRKVKLDFSHCKTANDKLNVLEREIEAGTLTTAEIKHLAEFIKAGAEINEKTDIVKKVDELLKLAGKA